MQARVRFVSVRRNPLRRSCVSRARNAGESAFCLCPAQPSAEIVHVEGAKCRRECVLARSGATLCGDRACRGREVQARVRFVSVRGAALCGDRACRGREVQVRSRFGFFAGSPLRRSCVSSARNAGEIACWTCPAQPSAEIVRVEGAKMPVRYQKWPVCSTNVVRERASRSWTQKWPVRERSFWSWTHTWPVCSANVVRERAFWSWTQKCGDDRDVAVPCGFAWPWWKVRLRGAVPLGSAKHAGVNAACRW